DISIDGEGWCGGRPVVALDADRIPEARAVVCAVDDGRVRFSKTVSVDASPMVGCIGTAPENGRTPSEKPGRNGGNMDHRVIGKGAVVHLPVAHRGGYLYLGDVH